MQMLRCTNQKMLQALVKFMSACLSDARQKKISSQTNVMLSYYIFIELLLLFKKSVHLFWDTRSQNMRMHPSVWLRLVLKSNNDDLVHEPMCLSCFITLMTEIHNKITGLNWCLSEILKPRRFSFIKICKTSGQNQSPPFLLILFNTKFAWPCTVSVKSLDYAEPSLNKNSTLRM